MNVHWKLKSFIFSVIDFFNVPRVLYFLQKYFSKRSRVENLSVSPIWKTHKKILTKYGATKIIFEFGAGKTLAQNLYLSDLVEKQIVVDLNPMIDLTLVENVRHQISKLVDLKSDIKIETLQKLRLYGIEYRAPYDAAETDFNEKSIDACVSTNTLEHIPEESILSIFLELYRILKDDGIVSAKIDYSDHYAHTDKTISLLNYLKFDQNGWKKHNHNCHFQNRLRHYDYVKIFKKCGFAVIEEDLVFLESQIPTEIIQAFKNNDETWKATSAHIVLKKKY
jgi:predicted SAM-dependent methyltransferase